MLARPGLERRRDLTTVWHHSETCRNQGFGATPDSASRHLGYSPPLPLMVSMVVGPGRGCWGLAPRLAPAAGRRFNPLPPWLRLALDATMIDRG